MGGLPTRSDETFVDSAGVFGVEFLGRRCQNRGVTLVWGFFCQGVRQCNACFCPSSVSLFDLKARFFVPTRSSARPSRAGAVKVGPFRHASPLPGHTVTALST